MDEKEDLWNQITYLTNKRAKEEQKKKEIRGGNCESVKKVVHTEINTKKLDEDTGDYSTKTSNIKLCKIIQQARNNSNLTQKQLAQKLQINANDYNKYESGASIPDNKLLLNMQRKLKVKLTGKTEELGKCLK